MSNDLERWLNLKIYIKADRPELLTGLDELLRLELISEVQVRSLARNYLTCPVQIRSKAETESYFVICHTVVFDYELVLNLCQQNRYDCPPSIR